MKRQTTAAVGIVIALGLWSSAAEAQQNLRPVTLVASGTALHYMGNFVAQKRGYYAEEGIALDWVTTKSGAQSAAAVMGGSADLMSTGFFEIVKAAAMGAKMAVLAPQFDIYATSLVLSNAAMSKNGITTSMPIDEKLKRMKGLQIGISAPGSNSDAFIRSLYLARNMNPDREVVLRPLGGGAELFAAFEQKITDGFVWAAPMPELAVLKGLGQVAVNPFSGEVPELNGVPFTAFGASRDAIAQKPEVLRAVLRAYTKAMKWIRENEEDARKLVRTAHPEMDDASFNSAFHTYIPGLPKTPVVSEKQFDHALEWLNLGAKNPIKTTYEASVAPAIAREVERDLLGK